ncbi:MAG: hypothetical protein ACREBG_00265 [Pyrinomonadaceae bacterium]
MRRWYLLEEFLAELLTFTVHFAVCCFVYHSEAAAANQGSFGFASKVMSDMLQLVAKITYTHVTSHIESSQS